jgi:capsular polysaccharide biosynthesis protein
MFDNNTETSLNIIKTIYSKRKLLIILLVGAFIASIVVTKLTPKRYKASGTVYAVNSNAYNDIIYNPTFGKEIDADRLIQLFESNFVTDSIIREFNLAEYYKVDPADPMAQYYLYENYKSDIEFSRTRYLSVTIRATTKNAELSANIVNRLINLIDSEREKILKTNVKLITENYRKEYNSKRKSVDDLLNKIYALSNKKGNSSQSPLFKNREKFMEERQKNTHIYPGDEGVKQISKTNQTQEVESLINDYYFMQGRMNFARQKLDEAETKLNQPIPSVYKISLAKPIHKKVSPSMMVNAILFVMITLVLSLLFILGFDQLKRIKKEISN